MNFYMDNEWKKAIKEYMPTKNPRFTSFCRQKAKDIPKWSLDAVVNITGIFELVEIWHNGYAFVRQHLNPSAKRLRDTPLYSKEILRNIFVDYEELKNKYSSVEDEEIATLPVSGSSSRAPNHLRFMASTYMSSWPSSSSSVTRRCCLF